MIEPIIVQVGIHIAYVFGFWAVWKVFNFGLEIILGNKSCSKCSTHVADSLSQDYHIKDLEREIKILEGEKRRSSQDRYKLELKVGDLKKEVVALSKTDPFVLIARQKVVEKVNVSTIHELDSIHGVGSKTAKKLLKKVPFENFD